MMAAAASAATVGGLPAVTEEEFCEQSLVYPRPHENPSSAEESAERAFWGTPITCYRSPPGGTRALPLFQGEDLRRAGWLPPSPRLDECREPLRVNLLHEQPPFPAPVPLSPSPHARAAQVAEFRLQLGCWEATLAARCVREVLDAWRSLVRPQVAAAVDDLTIRGGGEEELAAEVRSLRAQLERKIEEVDLSESDLVAGNGAMPRSGEHQLTAESQPARVPSVPEQAPEREIAEERTEMRTQEVAARQDASARVERWTSSRSQAKRDDETSHTRTSEHAAAVCWSKVEPPRVLPRAAQVRGARASLPQAPLSSKLVSCTASAGTDQQVIDLPASVPGRLSYDQPRDGLPPVLRWEAFKSGPATSQMNDSCSTYSGCSTDIGVCASVLSENGSFSSPDVGGRDSIVAVEGHRGGPLGSRARVVAPLGISRGATSNSSHSLARATSSSVILGGAPSVAAAAAAAVPSTARRVDVAVEVVAQREPLPVQVPVEVVRQPCPRLLFQAPAAKLAQPRSAHSPLRAVPMPRGGCSPQRVAPAMRGGSSTLLIGPAPALSSRGGCSPLRPSISRDGCSPLRPATSRGGFSPLRPATSRDGCSPLRPATSRGGCSPLRPAMSRDGYSPLRLPTSGGGCSPLRASVSQGQLGGVCCPAVPGPVRDSSRLFAWSRQAQ